MRFLTSILAICMLTACFIETPAETCEVLTEAYLTRYVECYGGTYAEWEEEWWALNEQLAGTSSCAEVNEVRDKDQIYEECLPWVESASCQELTHTIDPSCNDQLINWEYQ